MMDFPLTISHFLGRARALFADVEIVSRQPDKTCQRETYGEMVERCERLARALARLGVKAGDPVATLGWNHRQHLECYLGIPSMGAVVHTLNIRLHPDEIAYIANHAKDVAIVVDASLLPLFEKFRAKLTTVRHVIVVREAGDVTPLDPSFLDYETLLRAETVSPVLGGFAFAEDAPFPLLDERAAAMICYTSGTTGNPKGVVYSHRSTVLHALAISLKDAVGIASDDVVLPVVPMFHAAAWGTPFASVSSGAKLVFPGPHLDPTSLLDLMEQEKVTVAAGVPTIWLGILQLLDQHPGRWNLSSVRTMLIGGAAAPPSLIEGFEKRHGLVVTHAWGMTETNPLGTLARVKPSVVKRGPEAVLAARASQGIPVPFVELRHVDDQGKPLPWDGVAMGELEVRGPWVASSYFGDEGQDRFTNDGFFRTGDVVTIDTEGYVRITDRAKDVVKSGGEWISSVALENALMAHPAVLEAAVFAGKHEKWDERPLAAIVLKPGAHATDEQLAAHLTPHFAKFWLPDAYIYVEQVPRTSTGKFLKTKLRELYGDLLTKKKEALLSRRCASVRSRRSASLGRREQIEHPAAVGRLLADDHLRCVAHAEQPARRGHRDVGLDAGIGAEIAGVHLHVEPARVDLHVNLGRGRAHDRHGKRSAACRVAEDLVQHRGEDRVVHPPLELLRRVCRSDHALAKRLVVEPSAGQELLHLGVDEHTDDLAHRRRKPRIGLGAHAEVRPGSRRVDRALVHEDGLTFDRPRDAREGPLVRQTIDVARERLVSLVVARVEAERRGQPMQLAEPPDRLRKLAEPLSGGRGVNAVDGLHMGRGMLRQDAGALAVAEQRQVLVVELDGATLLDADDEAIGRRIDADFDLAAVVANHVTPLRLGEPGLAHHGEQTQALRKRLGRERALRRRIEKGLRVAERELAAAADARADEVGTEEIAVWPDAGHEDERTSRNLGPERDQILREWARQHRYRVAREVVARAPSQALLVQRRAAADEVRDIGYRVPHDEVVALALDAQRLVEIARRGAIDRHVRTRRVVDERGIIDPRVTEEGAGLFADRVGIVVGEVEIRGDRTNPGRGRSHGRPIRPRTRRNGRKCGEKSG